jgi:hypothetical protein
MTVLIRSGRSYPADLRPAIAGFDVFVGLLGLPTVVLEPSFLVVSLLPRFTAAE